MIRRFVISDTHFGHERLVEPRSFASIENMNQAMIDAWCDTVSAEDTVYHLGDVVMNRRYLAIMPELPGRKILVKGNHDVFPLKDYLKAGFDDIRACVVRPDMILTHIPLHPDDLIRYGLNLHGHRHAHSLKDPRYVNVCVEKTGYMPLSLEAAMSRAGARHFDYADLGDGRSGSGRQEVRESGPAMAEAPGADDRPRLAGHVLSATSGEG